MSISLEQLSDQCREILSEKSGADALESVRQVLEKVLVDDAFVAAHIGPQETAGRKVLFEDPDLGFTICAHARGNKAESPPHDHGNSWAIYGQVAGETQMTDWRKLSAPEGDKPGTVEAVRTYTLKPGMAKYYNVGDLHSPSRSLPTRLIRIEGRNMDNAPQRDRYVVAETAS
jgi:predicted metal-dependent enzyme (double-stranded beta helix superfamily)